VRIRIALGTAAAVMVLPAIFFACFSTNSAASARPTRHEASSQHRTVRINDTLMSYAQAEAASKMVAYSNAVVVAYANAVEAGEVHTYLSEIAYLRTVAAQRQQAAAQATAAAQAAAPARAQAAVTPAPAPAPVPAPTAGGSDATSTNTPDWACIRQHESGDNYSIGNGGAYQFELSTWTGLTGLPSPAEDYPAAVQDAAALKLYSQRGWEPWTTRYVCGL
jgi:pyruvate/2-oxoglutarate dehydrogenase complex dihydrolipoamide acyltransferase (E2) component